MTTSSKLLLFDIDGTLMRTNRIPLNIVKDVLAEFVDREIDWSPKDFAGSTDRKIIRTLIRKNNITTDDIETSIDSFLKRYLDRLEQTLKERDVVNLLPGVTDLLATCSTREFSMGLVTGNVERGARLKLGPPNFNPYFPIGAFGNDAEDRNLLPNMALERAEQHYQRSFDHKDCWIIGDTPHDVECAKVSGMNCLAVTTGIYDATTLGDADYIAEDLSDTENIINQFL
ncbi:MAG: HAD family hydrolase [Calditrichota bacterium]